MNDKGRELTSVLTGIAGHVRARTIRYTTTGVIANGQVITCPAGKRLAVTRVSITLAKDALQPAPAVRLGFHATTTPTTDDVVASHAGVPPGGGITVGNGGGLLGVGGVDQHLLLTCADPGGALDVVVTYLVLEN